uniref:PEPxxWA-CTERM sorting domain-containing protein n=1 Tax=Sphingomonas folli TaxID=2862497 RepID=UPI0021562880|nr:PEPxxWA-CTERM sorting domain-containing protein [Sphingomonas folli]
MIQIGYYGVAGSFAEQTGSGIPGSALTTRGWFVLGRLGLSSVRIDVAAVPEPASWTMLIVGFGEVGSALRHHRSPTVFKTA